MKNILKVANNLTSDPLNRQGHLCVEVGRKDDAVEVLFPDGVRGLYAYDAFEDLDDSENPKYLLQGTNIDLLKMITVGVFDVKELAKKELDNLGVKF